MRALLHGRTLAMRTAWAWCQWVGPLAPSGGRSAPYRFIGSRLEKLEGCHSSSAHLSSACIEGSAKATRSWVHRCWGWVGYLRGRDTSRISHTQINTAEQKVMDLNEMESLSAPLSRLRSPFFHAACQTNSYKPTNAGQQFRHRSRRLKLRTTAPITSTGGVNRCCSSPRHMEHQLSSVFKRQQVAAACPSDPGLPSLRPTALTGRPAGPKVRAPHCDGT